MAAAFDARTTVESDTGTTLGGTHTPSGTPTLVLLSISIADDGTITSSPPTYAATAMTLVSGPITEAGDLTAYVYKLESPPAGAQTFSTSLNKANKHRQVTVATFTGTLSSGATRTPATATNASSSTPSVAVTTVAGDLVYDVMTHSGNDVARTAGADQTKVWEYYTTAGATNVGAAASTETAIGVSTTMSWTLGASRPWGIIAIPIIGVALETFAVDITASTSVAIAVSEVANESVVIGISAAPTVSIAASISIPPVCAIPPPFNTALFGTESPATLYVALLSYPWGVAQVPVELTGCGYARVAVPNTTTYWTMLADSIRNRQQITWSQATCDQGTAKGWAIYNSATLAACENLIAYGEFGLAREIVEAVHARIPAQNLVLTTTRGTATLVTIEVSDVPWTGYVGRVVGMESGVCQTCGFTVPVHELRYNRRYGWQCLPGGYGPGCWDGEFQRDEIQFFPPPNEGARLSPTPTGRITDDVLPTFGSGTQDVPGYGDGGYGEDDYGD